jgi:hypothetical protein
LHEEPHFCALEEPHGGQPSIASQCNVAPELWAHELHEVIVGARDLQVLGLIEVLAQLLLELRPEPIEMHEAIEVIHRICERKGKSGLRELGVGMFRALSHKALRR